MSDRVHSRRFASWTNWGRNFRCRPAWLHAPDSVEGVAAVVRQAREAGHRVRAVGSGYSYTRLVQTDEVMVSLDRFQGLESIDPDTHIATVRAGTPLRRLVGELAARGFALENLGDIDRQTLAGAVATGTHGTGITLGNMSTHVQSLELVTADGSVMECSNEADPDQFRAALVSLGSLGVITRVRLRVRPMYWLAVERRRLTFDQVLEALDGNVRGHRNYEFFWFPNSDLVYSKAMNPALDATGGGRTMRRYASDLINENAALWVVCQINDRWPSSRERLLALGAGLIPQDRSIQRADAVYATERLVVHQEMEYAVPYERTTDVLAALNTLFRRARVRTMFPVEVRFTRNDDIWLSPSSGRDVAWIAVHTYQKEDHREYFDMSEDVFLQAGGRPHWGKLHGLHGGRLRTLYPEWESFNRVRRRLDPAGIFENQYLRRVLSDSAAFTLVDLG